MMVLRTLKKLGRSIEHVMERMDPEQYPESYGNLHAALLSVYEAYDAVCDSRFQPVVESEDD